jgi:hypothetical protein
MPRTSEWRLSSFAADLNQIDQPSFAWEFLRRNRGYQRDYEHITRHETTDPPNKDATAARAVQRWGLSCPLRSEAAGKPGAGSVAAGIPPDRRSHRRCSR